MCPISNNVSDSLSFVKSSKIRILFTGDLAYYASILGKVNMSGNWCTWCNLHKEDWKQSGHETGHPWTIQQMDDLREAIYNGEINDEAKNRKGCVDIRLFDKMKIDNFIFPVLHAEIGLGNSLINSFFDWVDYRIEEVTEEERQKKQQFAPIQKKLNEMKTGYNEWSDNEGYDLATLKIEKGMYKESRNVRDKETNDYILCLQERQGIDNIISDINDRIKPIQEQKKELESDLKLKRKVCNALKKELDTFKQGRGKRETVRTRMELNL